MNELESFMAEIQPVLLRYARRKWRWLFTSPEDLVQETLIYIWNNYDKKIKDHKEKEGHCCKALGYIALNTLLKEHKDGLWAGVSNSKTNCKGRIIETDFNYYDRYNEPVNDMRDPWLEEFYSRRKEYNRKWYLDNREQIIEKNKKYYQENKEKRIEYRKRYYQENKEKQIKYKKRYYEEHKEYYKEYAKRYSGEHKEDCREYSREYRRKHREYFREYNKERYKKIKELRNEICQEYNITISIKMAEKLYAAKRKSEDKFNDLIAEIIRNN